MVTYRVPILRLWPATATITGKTPDGCTDSTGAPQRFSRAVFEHRPCRFGSNLEYLSTLLNLICVTGEARLHLQRDDEQRYQ